LFDTACKTRPMVHPVTVSFIISFNDIVLFYVLLRIVTSHIVQSSSRFEPSNFQSPVRQSLRYFNNVLIHSIII